MKLWLTAALAVTALGAAGCSSSTSSGPTSAPKPAPTTSASTSASAPASSTPAPGPVSNGPTTTATAQSCPLLTQGFVADTLGMRQGRIAVLHSAGKLVGCRFYASQVEPLHTSENLPGPKQPVAEVTMTRYSTSTAAHNAFVAASRRGTQASKVTISSGVPGVTYRTRVDPADRSRDWACGYSVGTTAVLIRAAEDDSALEVTTLAQQVLRALR